MNSRSRKGFDISSKTILQFIKSLFIALSLVIAAMGFRVLLLNPLASELPWITFYPIVLIAAYYGGFFTALLTILFASIVVTVVWPLIGTDLLIINKVDYIEMAIFTVISVFIAYLIARLTKTNKLLKQTLSSLNTTRQRESFLLSILNAMPNMVGYWDNNLRCQFANNAYRHWFDKQPEEIIGLSFQALAGDELYELNKPHINKVLAGEPQRFERALLKTDGSKSNILGQYIPDFAPDGSVIGFSIQSSEITDIKETQDQLKLASYVFDNTVDGVLITDMDGVILSVNPAFVEITGYSAEEAVGQTPRMIKSNWYSDTFYKGLWNEIINKGQWNGELWSKRKNGELFLERISIRMVRDAEGVPIRYISVFSDITELWQKDEKLKHLAFYDPLTNLPNRTLLIERMDKKITNLKQEKVSLAVMFLDLDGFKLVNDQFGHNIGDDILKHIAARLESLVRESDTVARLGGDEFIFVLNNPKGQDEIAEVANRVLHSINQPITIQDNVFQIGTSIGISLYPEHGVISADLIKNADKAMYASKDSGRNKFCFYSA